jgi:mersacidin/lichenicidin family type 2 lantibiotic
MSNLEVVRAWKDPEFRATLGVVVPDHPAGQIEFADPLLDRTAAQLEGPNLSHHCHSYYASHSERCCTL